MFDDAYTIDPASIQNVAVGAAAVASAAIAAGAQPDVFVRIASTSDAYFLVGTAPVVTAANGAVLPAGIPTVIRVAPGSKISVLEVTAGGVFSIAVVG